jgi:hypothetical protein
MAEQEIVMEFDLYVFMMDMLRVAVTAYVTGYAIHKGQQRANNGRRKRKK